MPVTKPVKAMPIVVETKRPSQVFVFGFIIGILIGLLVPPIYLAITLEKEDKVALADRILIEREQKINAEAKAELENCVIVSIGE